MIDYNDITFNVAKVNNNTAELSFIFDRKVNCNILYKLNYIYNIYKARFIDNKIIIVTSISNILDILKKCKNNTTSLLCIKNIDSIINKLNKLYKL